MRERVVYPPLVLNLAGKVTRPAGDLDNELGEITTVKGVLRKWATKGWAEEYRRRETEGWARKTDDQIGKDSTMGVRRVVLV